MAKNLWRSRVSTKQRPDLDSACLKTPITTFCLTILMDLHFFWIFWVQILSSLPPLQEGTTAGFPALGSSHNRPCVMLLLEFQLGQKTEASVHLVEISLIFYWFCWQEAKCVPIFSVARVHLAKPNDPFGHTRPIGRRFSMASLDHACNIFGQK